MNTTGRFRPLVTTKAFFLLCTILTWSLQETNNNTAAAEYDCKIEKKLGPDMTYTLAQLEKDKFSVKIEEDKRATFVSRCSFALSAQKVTCDRYQVDKVVFDENVKIKKYYLFRSQFDVQLFPDLSFVENNGRGGIGYGKCRLVVP
jgi:hypothetical protein